MPARVKLSRSAPAFAALCRDMHLPIPVPEYQFAPPRKWRFDWAWVGHKIALEIEGGVYTRGRHLRPRGFLADIDKYNTAAIMGWRLVRCTPEQFAAGDGVLLLGRALREG